MANSIKLFQFLQKSYKTLGICPSQDHEGLAFNTRNVIFLFCYAQMFLSVLAFFIFKADTMLEYGNSFFMFETQFYIAMDFLVLMWRITNILELIEEFEEFIEKSKKIVKC